MIIVNFQKAFVERFSSSPFMSLQTMPFPGTVSSGTVSSGTVSSGTVSSDTVSYGTALSGAGMPSCHLHAGDARLLSCIIHNSDCSGECDFAQHFPVT